MAYYLRVFAVAVLLAGLSAPPCLAAGAEEVITLYEYNEANHDSAPELPDEYAAAKRATAVEGPGEARYAVNTEPEQVAARTETEPTDVAAQGDRNCDTDKLLHENMGKYEMILAKSGITWGCSTSYGIDLDGPPHVELVEVAAPSLSIPLTDAVGRSFYRGVLDYRVEGIFGLVTNMNDRGEAGLSPIGFRYYLTGLDGRVNPFVEGMMGAVYLNVPGFVQGTRFNFVEGSGAGVAVFVTDRAALDIRLRYRHLSNAGIKGPNSGVTSGFLTVGMSYY